ncbi:adenylate/guanylate cyclase domain-containing protein [Skermania sp. ID1734]|uniref:adenylate/guanylate cyclase domain-containing protein n=1 Tax=Skermania sp. ID1734 TaxID=2597516 RepID=UPI00117FE722|nr:adenylate/guanylate cyclase domain-containing protein [Skermania sp. ID1734]TSE01101.1 adenylate/guanylate cyclase domain-containing protein [Skermania sp. ID1734]
MLNVSDSKNERVDPQAFAESVEALLLGGPRTLTPLDLAQRANLHREAGRRLWQSMGFASVDEEGYDNEISLTDYDLVAAQRIQQAIESGIATFEETVSLSRLAGQIFAQLAESEGEAMYALALRQPGGFTAAVETLGSELLPFIEELHTYVWRRQLAAFVARKAMQLGKHLDADQGATVGFADISGFTALSRRTGQAELADLLELFESVATDAVGAHGGRVVKLIGDAVLYTVAEPVAGVEIAAELLESWPATQPPIRAGVATGPILRRLGDVFGPTVNIASRLTSVGRPGEVRVDEATATAVTADPRFHFEAQPPQDVRGYDQLPSWRLVRN